MNISSILRKKSEEEEFLHKFGLTKEDLVDATIEWKELKSIKNKFLKLKPQLEITANDIVGRLFKAKKVHSIRYRIKDENHLLEKVVRKRKADSKRDINHDTFQNEITDLIGLRVLHLYKSDWKSIHDFIIETYNLVEKPIVYIRDGDETEMYEGIDCNIQTHKNNYRSVHYLIKLNPTKETFIAEVQVRTLFEEAWSEIDHDIRYPYNMDNKMIGKYLDIFNRISGSADEMGMYIKSLERKFAQIDRDHFMEVHEQKQEIQKLQDKISQLSIDDTEKDELKTTINKLPVFNSHISSYFEPNYKPGLSLQEIIALYGDVRIGGEEE